MNSCPGAQERLLAKAHKQAAELAGHHALFKCRNLSLLLGVRGLFSRQAAERAQCEGIRQKSGAHIPL